MLRNRAINRNRWRWAVVVGLVLAGLICVRQAGTVLVVRQPFDDPDVVVSLASHEWERLPLAAELAGRFPEARILLTQPPVVTDFNCHDCARRVDRLASLGVSRSRVEIVPIVGSGTHGEAVAVSRYLARNRLTRLLIVTSPYHTRRALATFRAESGTGVRVGIVPADATSPAKPAAWWWTPYDRWYVRYEWAATLYYAFRYRVYPFRLNDGPDESSRSLLSDTEM